MGWKTLDDAERLGPSRAAWERRIEGNRVPHYLDAASGRRMVWIEANGGERSSAPPPARELSELRQTVAELRSLINDLRQSPARTRAILPRRPAPPLRARPPRTSPTPSLRKPSSSKAASISEAEVARIMSLRAACPLGDKALQRAAGLASNWFWKVKRGQCRSAMAVEGWRRLEAFLGEKSVRRAA